MNIELIQQGWQCPCCSRIYSPTTSMCFTCPTKVETAPNTSPPKHQPCPYVVSTREGTHHCSLSHREPLTDERIWLEYQKFWMFHPSSEPTLAKDIVKFARAIEAAHNIFGEKK